MNAAATLVLLSAAGASALAGEIALRDLPPVVLFSRACVRISKLQLHSILHSSPYLRAFPFFYSAPGTKYKVAVIGGGPSGACAAEALATNPNIECILFERKMDNAKPW